MCENWTKGRCGEAIHLFPTTPYQSVGRLIRMIKAVSMGGVIRASGQGVQRRLCLTQKHFIAMAKDHGEPTGVN